MVENERLVRDYSQRKVEVTSRKNILVSGGVSSLFQGPPVNEYDVYIQVDVLIRLAQALCLGTTTLGVDKEVWKQALELMPGNIQSSLKLTMWNSVAQTRSSQIISSIGMKKAD
jgi:hypothetical protein